MKNNGELSKFLSKAKFKAKSWVDNLEERKKEELEFHNFDRENDDKKIVEQQEEIQKNRKFYSVTEPLKEYMKSWLSANVSEKVFLDYACGDGSQSVLASQLGAEMSIGIDISDVSIINATKIAENLNLKNCYFFQADCENTELPDESIDIVLCSGMLHHLDLNIAFPELERILKKNGKILCAEALSVNPVIQYYRDKTPEMRTEWEKAHILGPKDLKFAKKYFRVSNIKYWFLFALLAVPFRNTIFFNPLNSIFQIIDRIALKIPFFNRLAWQFTFVLNKK